MEALIDSHVELSEKEKALVKLLPSEVDAEEREGGE